MRFERRVFRCSECAAVGCWHREKRQNALWLPEFAQDHVPGCGQAVRGFSVEVELPYQMKLELTEPSC